MKAPKTETILEKNGDVFSQKALKNSACPPLVSDEIDLAGLPGFVLNVAQLLTSELMAKADGEVFKAAVRLWCFAWQQKPPSSLPDDNKTLAVFSGLSRMRFKSLKNEVMRGFVQCTDGRWYHPVLAECAHAAHRSRTRYRKEREADTARLRNWRKRQRETGFETGVSEAGETPVETGVSAPSETGVVTPMKRTEEKRSELKEVTESHPDRPVGPPKEKARGTRWPADAQIPPEWTAEATAKRHDLELAPVNIAQQAEMFTNYWSAKTGKDATKLDWKRTFINWVLKAEGERHANGHARTRSRSDTELAGARAAADFFLSQGRTEEGGADGPDALPRHPPLRSV